MTREVPPDRTQIVDREMEEDSPDSIEGRMTAEEQRDAELSERYEQSGILQKFVLELAFMVYVFALMVPSIPMADVFMQKACLLNLHFNQSVCDHLNENSTIKAEVEIVSNYYGTLKDIVATLPGAAVSLIGGQYMSRYGMKTPILVALSGAKMSMLMQMLTFYYKSSPLFYTVLAQLPTALTGGIIVLLTAVYTNIATSCPSNKRRQRFLMVIFFIFLPVLIATSVGSILYSKLGIVFLMASASLLLIPPTMLIVFCFKDVEMSDEAKEDNWKEVVKHSIGLSTLKQSFTFLVRPRPGFARAQLYAMTISLLIGTTAFLGTPVYYLYVNLVLQWDVKRYGTIDAITMLIVFILTFPLMMFFNRVLKLSDCCMASIGYFSFTIKFFLFAMLKYGQGFYFAQALVGLPFYVGVSGVRSHISKLLAPKEVAVVFALISAAERLAPMASDAIIMVIYNATVQSFAGAVFAAQGALFILPTSLTLLCAIWTRRFGLPEYSELGEQ